MAILMPQARKNGWQGIQDFFQNMATAKEAVRKSRGTDVMSRKLKREEEKELAELEEAAALKDPNSPQSARARELLGTAGIRLPGQATAAEIQGPIGKMVADLRGKSIAATAKHDAQQPKQNEFAAAGYANRAEQAETAMQGIAGKGFDASSGSAEGQRFAQDIPIIGRWARGYTDANLKMQEQAELNFLSAVLRKESGASISESERQTGNLQYFPRYGDDPDTLKQKAQNRAAAIAALRAEGERALPRVQGQQVAASPPPAPRDPAQQPVQAGAPGGMGGAGSSGPSPEDIQALSWAKANPQDPRSKAIMESLRQKGVAR
jgi:hypothetical protein